MKKLECMAYTCRHDAHISGYPIPFCCESATLRKMYTMEELRAAGVVTAITTSANPVTSGWPAGSEFEESDITNTEGLREVIEESTDMEMARQTHTLMITSDREKVQLEALVKEQDCAIDKAVRQVQEWHLEEVQDIADAVRHWEDGWSNFKHCSASQEEDVKRSHGESPEYGSAPWERGCSLHRKSKSDLQYLASPDRRCLASQSFTPFGHRSHSRPWSHSRHHSHSRSSMPGWSHHRDSTPHTSRKRPVAKTPRLTEATPTQLPAQKTPKLKSLVQRALATKNYCDPPYNCLDKDPKEFIRYVMGNLDRKAYDAEIRCLAAFYSQATVLAHCVITSIITTLVAANRGIHFLVLVIPRELMSSLNNPHRCRTSRGSHPQQRLPNRRQSPLCPGMDVFDASLTVLVWCWFGLYLRLFWPSQSVSLWLLSRPHRKVPSCDFPWAMPYALPPLDNSLHHSLSSLI